MMRTLALGFAALIGSAVLWAQQQSYGTAGMENLIQPSMAQSSNRPAANERANACPVRLHADQGGDRQLVETRHGASPAASGPRQRIRLTLAGLPADRRIVAGRVTAQGLSPRSRIVGTGNATNAASTAQTTQDVKFTTGENGLAWADLLLPGFSSVSSIQLESITYADGSIWKIENTSACRVAPDPVMLVADR